MAIRIAPSILSANFADLGDQIKQTEDNGADRIHVDVMDGHFVRNLSMGPAIVKSVSRVTRLPLEIHLMVERPWRYATPFREAGASTLIVHLEAFHHPLRLVRYIRSRGMKVGVAVKPSTPIAELTSLLREIDLALCMTVEPGFAGRPFVPESPERIRRLRALINIHNAQCELEVDGGIDKETAPKAVDAGANVLVAATAIFGHPQGPGTAVREFIDMFAGQ